MSHSVSGHLILDIVDYDREIRRMVPAYEAMQQVQLDLLCRVLGAGPCRILDLGGGTGALAAAVANRLPVSEIEIWDTDPQMLEVARSRCAGFGGRVRGVERSFSDPLPACDAVVACIALHHVKDMAVKGAIYRNIFSALRPGGLFVNADTAAAASGPARDYAFDVWLREMGRRGIGEREARSHFIQWAKEDYYPPLTVEFDLLRGAGFAVPECFWREGAAVVFGAIK